MNENCNDLNWKKWYMFKNNVKFNFIFVNIYEFDEIFFLNSKKYKKIIISP